VDQSDKEEVAFTIREMTTKERLHELVDELTEAEAAAALLVTERHRDDAMIQALASAPVDDEPTSPAEDRSAQKALDAYHRDDAIGPDELKRDLGLD
jgi:hypothetical protein